jgi:uncharacterized protein (DUF1330 family)
MSVYSISDFKVDDWDKYREYIKKVRPIIESYGGRYHIRGGEITVIQGKWKPNRLVVIEFPSKEDLVKFRTSAEYQPVAAIRKSASTTISAIIVDGYDGRTDNIPNS